MSGEELYQSLLSLYNTENKFIHNKTQFVGWLDKSDGTKSFQFKFPSKDGTRYNIKAIPQTWLINAKNTLNNGKLVDRNWFNNHFNQKNFNDCRATMALWLINNNI